jgi:4-alpha-glucanotransferase
VLPWEKDDGGFRDPKAFPRASVASWSTHDTAPIDGWWPDLPPGDRAALVKLAAIPTDVAEGPDDGRRSLALLAYLYGASSDLALVLAQELLGLHDRINTPGTVGPQNWTWRLPRSIEELTADAHLAARMAAIGELVLAAGR